MHKQRSHFPRWCMYFPPRGRSAASRGGRRPTQQHVSLTPPRPPQRVFSEEHSGPVRAAFKHRSRQPEWDVSSTAPIRPIRKGPHRPYDFLRHAIHCFNFAGSKKDNLVVIQPPSVKLYRRTVLIPAVLKDEQNVSTDKNSRPARTTAKTIIL